MEDIILEQIRSGDELFKKIDVLENTSLPWDGKVIAVILAWRNGKNYHKNVSITIDPRFFSKYVISENSHFF